MKSVIMKSVTLLSTIIFLASPLWAQEQRPQEYRFEYAAKIVCGIQKEAGDLRLVRGMYATTINIHNPSDSTAEFYKKLALTFPPKEQRPGRIHALGTDKLRYDEALKVDCMEIQARLFPNGFPPPGYIEGFVIVQSKQSLDVTSVYTTAAIDGRGRMANQNSIDVEQVLERQKGPKQNCADLVPVPDSLGFFCKIVDGKLIVTVKNQGTCRSGSSRTRVDFFTYGSATMPTPALNPGESRDLIFEISPNCFDSDCEFRISVDVLNEVSESDEGNNTANGNCIG